MSILCTVSRCSPNTRAASRLLIPSTKQALRTRRYISTLYIQSTFHQVRSNPIEGERRYSFQTPHPSARPAQVVHYLSGLPSFGQNLNLATFYRQTCEQQTSRDSSPSTIRLPTSEQTGTLRDTLGQVGGGEKMMFCVCVVPGHSCRHVPWRFPYPRRRSLRS